jgi:hypothetical protein
MHNPQSSQDAQQCQSFDPFVILSLLAGSSLRSWSPAMAEALHYYLQHQKPLVHHTLCTLSGLHHEEFVLQVGVKWMTWCLTKATPAPTCSSVCLVA